MRFTPTRALQQKVKPALAIHFMQEVRLLWTGQMPGIANSARLAEYDNVSRH